MSNFKLTSGQFLIGIVFLIVVLGPAFMFSVFIFGIITFVVIALGIFILIKKSSSGKSET